MASSIMHKGEHESGGDDADDAPAEKKAEKKLKRRKKEPGSRKTASRDNGGMTGGHPGLMGNGGMCCG